MTTTIWIAFILYTAAAVYLSWRSLRRGREGADFWTAGRNLSSTSVGLSISAGFMSISWSCVYAVQLFYWYGLGAIWLITIPWLLSLTGIYFLARRYHQLPAFSQPEMVGQRFGPATRRFVALALAFVFLVWGGAEIYVAGTLLAPQMAVSKPVMILIISSVVMIYATLGGFRAVVATDKLQYVIVALYILTIGLLAIRGLSAADLSLPDPDTPGTKAGLGWTHVISPGIAMVLVTMAAYLPGWLFETDLWVRVQAAKDTRSARAGVALAGINAMVFVGILPLFIGVAAIALFPSEGGLYPATVGYEGESIFTALVSSFAPAWLAVLVSVGLIAAAMSTIDTCANVMALSTAYDIFEIHKRADAQVWSRLATAGAVAAAFVFALNTESLWDIFYLSSGVLTTAVAFPVAAVFIPRADRLGVLWSSIGGLAGIVAAYFLETHGPLVAWEPQWIVDTGLGFVLWGILAAAGGYVCGAFATRIRNSRRNIPG